MTETEVADIFDNKTKAPEPSEEDLLLAKMLEVYEEREWNPHGWNAGNMVCILESANVARFGETRSSTAGIKKAVIERIHKAIWPELSTKHHSKDTLATDIIRWNDGGAAKRAGGKKEVIRVLKKALKRSV